jgi:DNA polymerase-3 subunit epsilon
MKPTTEELALYKEKAAAWAKERLADANTVVLDLESTGLLHRDPETEIAQICVVDVKGRQLFSMLLKPSQPMSNEVIGIHKITNVQVQHQPLFRQVAKLIAFVLKDKHVVAFNADFDWKLLIHMFKKYNQELPEISGVSCCMDKFSEWTGEYSEKKGGFKWQPLPNFSGTTSHDAFNDCLNTLKVMQKLSGFFNSDEVSAEDIDLNF